MRQEDVKLPKYVAKQKCEPEFRLCSGGLRREKAL